MKKHVCSALLALLLLISVFPLGAFAAPSFPTLSSSNYCEMIAPAQINVYCDYNMTTRGTLSPYKEYNAYLDAGDTVQILEVTSSYVVLNYPTPSGTKTGVVNTSHIFGTSEVKEYISSSKASVSTYSSNSSANRYGSIAVGDEVFRLGSTKNGYILVIYTAQSGSRAYKAAFITSGNYDLVKSGSTSNASSGANTGSATTDVFNRIGEIAKGNRTLDSNTVMKVGSTFSGTNQGQECKGYARNVFQLLFGVNVGSTQDKPMNYLLNSAKGVSFVGSVTDMSNTNVQNLFANARPGDFVQIRRSHGGSHSAIVVKTTSSSVTFIEANVDGRNTISLNEYSWSDLCGKNAAMALYTACNYALA